MQYQGGVAASMLRTLTLTQVHWVFCAAAASVLVLLLLPLLLLPLLHSTPSDSSDWSSWWPIRLGVNLIGYGSVLLPAYAVVLVARGWDYESRGPRRGLVARCVRLVAIGAPAQSELHAAVTQQQRLKQQQQQQQQQQESSRWTAAQPYTLQWTLHLAGCFVGLQAAYLTWGVLQERIMTFDYAEGERFTDSQFLVFANRVLAGLLALSLVLATSRQAHRAPVFDYSYSSLSNILSSWCQYEALRYVTFPTQVLAKAAKVIPVMLMGRLVSKKTYRLDEYATAALLSAGTGAFLLSNTNSSSSSSSSSQSEADSTSISGAALLAGYMLFDSFTSTWQSRLFVQHKVSSLQMMAGTNIVSTLLTIAAQLEQGSLPAALAFSARHPLFLFHLVLLSLCSALGQLVIFHTIERFGSVTFIIIMTTRQAFAILISCVIYQHSIGSAGWLGVSIVFAALFLRILFGQRQQRRAREKE